MLSYGPMLHLVLSGMDLQQMQALNSLIEDLQQAADKLAAGAVIQAQNVDYQVPDIDPDSVEYATDEWDGSDAVASYPNPSEDDTDMSTFRANFLLAPPMDSDEADVKSAYKLPVRNSHGGSVNVNALQAVQAAINGARGGLEGVSSDTLQSAYRAATQMRVAAGDLEDADEAPELEASEATEADAAFTCQIEAADTDADSDGLHGIVWASGSHDLWVNGEPTSVHVPDDTIPDTFQRLQERMSAGSVKIGFDHPDDQSVAAQTPLGEIGEAEEFSQDSLDDGREAITMRESSYTNSKAVEAAEAGSFDGMGFSIVGNIALETDSSGQPVKRDGELQIAATDIHRVDVVPDQAVEGAKHGNLPNLADAAAAAGRMAASSPRQKADGLVATLRAASSSIEGQHGTDSDGPDPDHGNSDANSSLISELDGLIADHDMERSEVISRMASEAGIEEGTVREILSDAGGIQCPPMQRLESFASVLDVSADRLVSAAEDGGCNYGDTEAHDSQMTDADFPTDPDSLSAAKSALDQASDAVEAKDEQIEELEAQVSSLSDEAEHFRQIAASQGVDVDADDFTPQDVVDAFSEDLRAEIADLEAALPKYDTEDQESRSEDLAGKPLSELEAMAGQRWREFGRSQAKRDELSAAVAADESVGNVEAAADSDESTEEAARSVMTAREIHAAEAKGKSPSEFIEAEYGVQPAEYGSEHELQAAISTGDS